MQEVRCKKCNKLLYKFDISVKETIEAIKNTLDCVDDYYLNYNDLTPVAKTTLEKVPKIEIKCPRCGELNTRKESVENV